MTTTPQQRAPPAPITTEGFALLEDRLWRLCGLHGHAALERFRPGFKEMIQHIARVLDKNSDKNGSTHQDMAALHGEWMANPVAAYLWWKHRWIQLTRERKGASFIEPSDTEKHRASAVRALNGLDALRLQVQETSKKAREVIQAQALRDMADGRSLECEAHVLQHHRRHGIDAHGNHEDVTGSVRDIQEKLMGQAQAASADLKGQDVKLALAVPDAFASRVSLHDCDALKELEAFASGP